jgi:hypothetical protein
MQLSDLQERHHRLTLQVGHLEHELDRDDDDEPQQYCLEALEPPEINSKPTPNFSQSGSSLVEQVAKTLGSMPENHLIEDWEPEARAAIREVAAWLRTGTDLDHGPTAARFLAEEAGPTFSQEGYDRD